MRWLRRSDRAFGGSTPLGLIGTELEARAVKNVLWRIAYGRVSRPAQTEREEAACPERHVSI